MEFVESKTLTLLSLVRKPSSGPITLRFIMYYNISGEQRIISFDIDYSFANIRSEKIKWSYVPVTIPLYNEEYQ